MLCILLLKALSTLNIIRFCEHSVSLAFEASFDHLFVHYLLDSRKGLDYLIVFDDIDLSRILDKIGVFLIFALHDAAKFLPELDKGFLYVF